MAKVDKKLAEAKQEAEKITSRIMAQGFHVAIQKGRIAGRMEAEGKTAAEIAKVLDIPEASVQRILDEDPMAVIASYYEKVEEKND